MKKRLIHISLSVLMSAIVSACSSSADWRTASRESANIAPAPEQHREAIIHVYGADAWGWRGWFAIHTWIAAKRSGEDFYTVYDVVAWRDYYGKPVIAARQDIPDRYWFGSKPKLLKELRGDGVDAVIDDIEQAVADYPWPSQYRLFPGPNSNTFTAWVGRQVPALELKLPFSAIGSGYAERYQN